MSVTITASPSPSGTLGGVAQVGNLYKTFSSSSLTTNTTLIQGSALKGIQNQTVWIMFEPAVPKDSTWISASLGLYQNTLNGIATTTLRIGWFANDGTWNDQDVFEYGLNKYAAFSPTGAPGAHPTRDGTSDAKWINNYPSFNPLTVTVAASPASGTSFSIGGGAGISPTFADADFVTDAQAAFASNEAHRNVRGVPMLMTILPSDSFGNMWTMASDSDSTASRRPLLTIVYDPPAIAAEITSSASVSAEAACAYSVASSISASASVAAEAVCTYSVASSISASASVSASAALAYLIASEISAAASVSPGPVWIRSAAASILASASVSASGAIAYGAACAISTITTVYAALSFVPRSGQAVLAIEGAGASSISVSESGISELSVGD